MRLILALWRLSRALTALYILRAASLVRAQQDAALTPEQAAHALDVVEWFCLVSILLLSMAGFGLTWWRAM